MRGGLKVHVARFSGYVLSEGNGEQRSFLRKRTALEKFPQHHDLPAFVRHLYSDHVFPRYRGYDSYAESLKTHCQIAFKRRYLVYFDPRGGLVLEHRDDRAGTYFHDLSGYSKVGEFFLNQSGLLVHGFFVYIYRRFDSRVKQIKWREGVVKPPALGCGRFRFCFFLGRGGGEHYLRFRVSSSVGFLLLRCGRGFCRASGCRWGVLLLPGSGFPCRSAP